MNGLPTPNEFETLKQMLSKIMEILFYIGVMTVYMSLKVFSQDLKDLADFFKSLLGKIHNPPDEDELS